MHLDLWHTCLHQFVLLIQVLKLLLQLLSLGIVFILNLGMRASRSVSVSVFVLQALHRAIMAETVTANGDLYCKRVKGRQ